jgi:hypothetical protein
MGKPGRPWKGKNLVSVTELPTELSSDTTQLSPEQIVNSTMEGGELKWIHNLLIKAIPLHSD